MLPSEKKIKELERYISKKHIVRKLEIDKNILIKKDFSEDLHGYYKEIYWIEKLSNKEVDIPKIIEVKDNKVFYDYIDGENFLDVFIKYEENNEDSKKLVKKLVVCILKLHKELYDVAKTYMIHGDVNFRNFILFNKELFILDFENIKAGEIEEDISQALVFCLTYNPINTKWKKEFAKNFLYEAAEYGYKLDKIIEFFYKHLKIIENRRNKKYNIVDLFD